MLEIKAPGFSREANIASVSALEAETSVGGLTGLSGWNYWSAKKYSPNQDLNREDNKG